MLLLLRVLGAGTPHNYGAVIYAESRRGCRLLLPWDAIIKLESVMLGRTMTRAAVRGSAGSGAAMPARCKLNFKMTMWRRDETLYRQ